MASLWATKPKMTTLRRVNGRPQACDPCRVRKVACDHTHPVCIRCRKRKQATQCIYTIASTSRRVPSIPPSSPSSLQGSPLPVVTGHAVAAAAAAPDSSAGGDSSSGAVLNPTPSSAAVLAGPGYLGYTSFSAVFEETRDSLSLLQDDGSRRGLLEECEVDPGTSGSNSSGRGPNDDALSIKLNGPTREMCLVVVRNIPHLSDKTCFPTMQQPPNHAGASWAGRAARRILHELQQSRYLSKRKDQDLEEELIQMLCRNTVKPMNDDVDSWEEWSAQFTGSNLRWESLGLLFIALVKQEEEEKSFWSRGGAGRKKKAEKSWGQKALACLRLCIDLAKSFCDGNLLQLHLCYRRSIMESIAMGDASLTCWRSHAEVVSLLSFLGLHAEPDSPNYVPTFSSEMKRRMFAYIFNIDKVSASFQGRPPLLGHRYASTPLPLDISDEALMEGPEAIAEAASKLDEKGWSRDSVIGAAKLIRGRTMIARIKDELLEIALGNSKHVSIDTLLDIKARATDIIAQFPPALIYNPEQDHDDPNLEVATIYARMLTRLEYLQNHFFVERLLLRRRGHIVDDGNDDDGELLRISFEMVSLTLTFWVHKDKFAYVLPDFEWLVMGYAAPGGGILCLELLRPSTTTTTSTSPTYPPRNPAITRSTIIQRLSLLVSFLGWVSPDAPNADLCANCETVIKHVLDHALNNNNSPVAGPAGVGAGALLGTFDDGGGQGLELELDGLGNSFNFDLLDTFGWLRAEENQMGEL